MIRSSHLPSGFTDLNAPPPMPPIPVALPPMGAFSDRRRRSGVDPGRANNQIQIEGFRSQAERTTKGKLFVKAEDADAADPFKVVLAVPIDKLPHIYIDCGTGDRLTTASRDFAKLLMENNIPFVYGESAGAHNGQYWSREIGTSVAVVSVHEAIRYCYRYVSSAHTTTQFARQVIRDRTARFLSRPSDESAHLSSFDTWSAWASLP